MKHFKVTIFALALVCLAACKEQKKEEHNQVPEVKTPQKTITVTPLLGSPAYSDAVLRHAPIKKGSVGAVAFNFELENYDLGTQTQSVNAEKLANSGKGQHIHFILNNQPYSAHYEPSFKKEIPPGVHHLVAFISRSYHESVKNEHSVVVQKLELGDDAKDNKGLDMNAPTLIYSRPKGTYTGHDTKNILLDFFVLNTELSETGTKVRATINGEVFMLNKWQPYVIEGLPLGEATIKLELTDTDGKVIEGPFNTVERKVTLKS